LSHFQPDHCRYVVDIGSELDIGYNKRITANLKKSKKLFDILVAAQAQQTDGIEGWKNDHYSNHPSIDGPIKHIHSIMIGCDWFNFT